MSPYRYKSHIRDVSLAPLSHIASRCWTQLFGSQGENILLTTERPLSDSVVFHFKWHHHAVVMLGLQEALLMFTASISSSSSSCGVQGAACRSCSLQKVAPLLSSQLKPVPIAWRREQDAQWFTVPLPAVSLLWEHRSFVHSERH